MIHIIKSTEAKRFFESPKLVRIRAEAGVKTPDFIYLDQLESGTLQPPMQEVRRRDENSREQTSDDESPEAWTLKSANRQRNMVEQNSLRPRRMRSTVGDRQSLTRRG